MIIFTKKQVMEEITRLNNEVYALNQQVLELSKQLSFVDGVREGVNSWNYSEELSDEEFTNLLDSMEITVE